MIKAHYYPGQKMKCLKDFGFASPNKGDVVFVQHVKVYPDGDYAIDVVKEYKDCNPDKPKYWHDPTKFVPVN